MYMGVFANAIQAGLPGAFWMMVRGVPTNFLYLFQAPRGGDFIFEFYLVQIFALG